MGKKIIMVVFAGLIVFSAIYALSDRKKVTTSSDVAYQAYLSGESLMRKLYYDDAVPEFEKAVKIDTNFAMAYAQLAMLYVDRDRMDEAKTMIGTALSLSDRITERERLYINVVKAMVTKEPKAIYEAQQEYIDKFPDDIYAYRYKAEQHLRDDHVAQAIAEFENIVAKDPGDALAYNMLGYLNYWNRNFDDALLYIKKYSMVAGKEANPHDSYGEILMHLGRYDDAIKEFEQANRIKPDLYFVLSHLGDVHQQIGKYRDAIGYYERAKDHAPSKMASLGADFDVALTYAFAGKNDRAIEVLEEMLQQDSASGDGLVLQGWVWARMGQPEKADLNLAKLDALAASRPESGENASRTMGYKEARMLLEAEIALARQNYDLAVANLSGIVQRIGLPDVMLTRCFLGRAYFSKGDMEMAETVLKDNLEDNPNHPTSLYYLALVYEKQNRTEDERSTLLRYLSVMSGADEDVVEVKIAREKLDALPAS